jgi:hypothetical protein
VSLELHSCLLFQEGETGNVSPTQKQQGLSIPPHAWKAGDSCFGQVDNLLERYYADYSMIASDTRERSDIIMKDDLSSERLAGRWLLQLFQGGNLYLTSRIDDSQIVLDAHEALELLEYLYQNKDEFLKAVNELGDDVPELPEWIDEDL